MTSLGQAAEGPQPGALPAELRALPQWCVTPGTATDKAPRTVDGRHASTTDPSTWADFDTACRAASERGWRVGFVFTANDPFTCIDLDVVNEQTQRAKGEAVDPSRWTTAETIERYISGVERLNSYTERSRSGFGLHVIVKGNIGRGRRRDGVEVYSQERFLICTGDVYRPLPVEDRQELLDGLVAAMTSPAPEVPLWGDPYPDFAVAGQAAEDGGELGRLFRGDWQGRYQSQSEADLALVKLILPLTETPRECWETFRLSKLGERDKAKRSDYAKRTMSLAVQHAVNDAAQLEHGRALAEGLFWTHNPEHFRVLYDRDLAQLPRPRWLVKGVIPETGIGVIYGDSGTFKSFLTLDLLAHLAHGREWFGHRVTAAPALYVPYEGQGGIPKRVEAWRLAETRARRPQGPLPEAPDDDALTGIGFIMEPLRLREQGDRDKLVKTLIAMQRTGGVLCIDTLAHASAGLDENSSEMGEMISALQDLQHRLGGVVLVVHHSGKDPTKGMRGWTGIRAAMDFIIACERPDREMPEAQFVLEKVKDGKDGSSFSFEMATYVLYQDEDGDWESSMTVVPTPEKDEGERVAPAKPTRKGINEIDAQTAAADNDFIFGWMTNEVRAGNFPSKNSLKGDLPKMKANYEITQDRVAAAVERLLSEGRVTVEKVLRSSSGNQWLRPVEFPPQVPT